MDIFKIIFLSTTVTIILYNIIRNACVPAINIIIKYRTRFFPIVNVQSIVELVCDLVTTNCNHTKQQTHNHDNVDYMIMCSIIQFHEF